MTNGTTTPSSARAWVSATWTMMDRAFPSSNARAFLAGVATDASRPPVFATVSGAHLYGFASPDSDIDLRGAFLRPAADVLGLRPSPETVTVMDDSVVELDWVGHDLRKFCRLLTSHNGYVLEQLYSPLVVLTSPLHEELLELAKGCVTRPTARHYLGFARGRRRRLREPSPTVKHVLYAYRVCLTGLHLMRTGRVEANLEVLNADARIADVDTLMARKRHGAEQMPLTDDEVPRHEAALLRLEEALSDAAERSSLPLTPTSVDALDALVVRTRLAMT